PMPAPPEPTPKAARRPTYLRHLRPAQSPPPTRAQCAVIVQITTAPSKNERTPTTRLAHANLRPMYANPACPPMRSNDRSPTQAAHRPPRRHPPLHPMRVKPQHPPQIDAPHNSPTWRTTTTAAKSATPAEKAS